MLNAHPTAPTATEFARSTEATPLLLIRVPAFIL